MANIKLNVAKLKLPNGKTVEGTMKSEIRRLKRLLQQEINRWYAGYAPNVYQRTYQLRDSIYVDDVVKVDGSNNTLTVRLKYTDNAYHKSLWNNDRVNVIYLMDKGYHVSKGWHKDIPFFGYRSPGGYLEDAVRAFNESSELGFKAYLNIPDSFYK